MDRVRPGKGKISRYIMVSHEGMTSSWKYADTREIDVEAGKTLTVNLGADSRVQAAGGRAERQDRRRGRPG